MKNLLMSINLLKKKKFINFIIICQIFFMLLYSVKNVKEIGSIISEYNHLKNSSLNNALFYMNKPDYINRRDKNAESNLDDIINNYNLVKEYIESHPDDFKSFTRLKTNFYIEDINKHINMYDKTTLNILSKKIDDNIDFNIQDNVVPAVVQRSHSNEYKIGDGFYLNEKKDVKIVVKGYYDDDTKLPSLEIISNRSFPISRLFPENRNKSPFFIVAYDENLYKYIEDFGSPQFQANIFYFNDKIEKEKIIEFENYIKENNLGYYQFTKNLIAEQYKLYLSSLQRYLDIMISLVGIVIITVVSVAYINKDLLKNRFKIYIVNGASKKDLYLITFYNYLTIFIISILSYIFFYKIIVKYLLNDFSIFGRLATTGAGSELSFDMITFIVVLVGSIILSMLVSILPILELKKEFSNVRGKI